MCSERSAVSSIAKTRRTDKVKAPRHSHSLVLVHFDLLSPYRYSLLFRHTQGPLQNGQVSAGMVQGNGQVVQNGGPGPSTAMQRETMEKVMARLEREFPDRE